MSQFTIANTESDGTTFTIPGEGESYSIDNAAKSEIQEWYIHIDNGWDVNADVQVRGSHYQDESLDSPAPDGSEITVNSGATDFVDGTTGHSFIDVQINPAADPTSGELTVTFQHRGE